MKLTNASDDILFFLLLVDRNAERKLVCAKVYSLIDRGIHLIFTCLIVRINIRKQKTLQQTANQATQNQNNQAIELGSLERLGTKGCLSYQRTDF